MSLLYLAKNFVTNIKPLSSYWPGWVRETSVYSIHWPGIALNRTVKYNWTHPWPLCQCPGSLVFNLPCSNTPSYFGGMFFLGVYTVFLTLPLVLWRLLPGYEGGLGFCSSSVLSIRVTFVALEDRGPDRGIRCCLLHWIPAD